MRGCDQGAVQAFDFGGELRKLPLQVAAVRLRLKPRHAPARGLDCGGMGLPLLQRARQWFLHRLHMGVRRACIAKQRLIIGFVLLIAPDLILQQRKGLRGLRLLALQSVEGFTLLGQCGKARASLDGLGLEILPGLRGLGAFMFAPQFGQAIDVGVKLRHGLPALVAFGQGARERVFGVLVAALGAAVAGVQQRCALGRHAIEQPVAVSGGQLAGELRQRIAQMRARKAGGFVQVLAVALADP